MLPRRLEASSNAARLRNGNGKARLRSRRFWESVGTWCTEQSSPTDSPASDAVSPSLEQSTNIEPTDGPVVEPERLTVLAATKAHLSKCEKREIQSSTRAKYKTLTNQLESFCARKGYIYIDQLRVIDMDDFYAEWKDGKKGKRRSRSVSAASCGSV